MFMSLHKVDGDVGGDVVIDVPVCIVAVTVCVTQTALDGDAFMMQ